ncbi:MAG: tRNA pseudouridine(55) synthase TruB [Anaerolineales bacterium]|nr:tRNA pseudouridine(55) synthase TruB [Anaerolineales bacterium]
MKDFGILVVDKPIGPTSHQIVSIVRRGTGIRKVGHAGTLDPRASGVLVLCLGQATRLSEYLSTSEKRYLAVIRFGASTRTYDSEGDILHETGSVPKRKDIEEALFEFRGEISQVPPPYSAIKVQGKRAYQLAREGKPPELNARKVIIHELKLISYKKPDLTLEIECSAGTYIRSIAHDLGEMLSTGAHLAELKRLKAGPFTIDDAIPLPKLEVGLMVDKWERYVIPAADALPDFPVVKINQKNLDLIRHGHRIPADPSSSGMARGISSDGELVAILEAVEDGTHWHPRKVFLG